MEALIQALLHAARPLLAPALTLLGSPVTWLEVGAMAVALAMVAANMRVHPVAWPLAIASSLAYALLFADSKLYGEAALQIVFIVLAGWGWWQWLRGTAGDGSALRVHRLGARAAWIAGIGTLVAWPLLGLALARSTDSDVPYLDALPTVASITGQVLLARKVAENWLVWLGVNVFSVGLFAYKALWLTAVLYALFAVLSWAGWRAWQRRLDA
jgi:nicotinamide mononucleotide transporter